MAVTADLRGQVEAWCQQLGLGVCPRCGCEARLRRGRCADCLAELLLDLPLLAGEAT
jgi:hypothetical protein